MIKPLLEVKFNLNNYTIIRDDDSNPDWGAFIIIDKRTDKKVSNLRFWNKKEGMDFLKDEGKDFFVNGRFVYAKKREENKAEINMIKSLLEGKKVRDSVLEMMNIEKYFNADGTKKSSEEIEKINQEDNQYHLISMKFIKDMEALGFKVDLTKLQQATQRKGE